MKDMKCHLMKSIVFVGGVQMDMVWMGEEENLFLI